MRRLSDSNRPGIRLIREESVPYPDSLETLERRLLDGYARIEGAIALGEDVTAWENFWIDLLRQYESAVDGLPVAA